MSINLAMELWFSAQEKGGGTFGRQSEKEYDGEGYVIGGMGELLFLRKDTRPIEAVEKIASWLDDESPNTPYVGSWVDGDEVYIDACDIRLFREEAEKLGRELKQIAIWDLQNKEEIRL